MTGAIAMSTNKITGAGDPTAAQDVATKAYVDTQDGLQVTKSGDTMSGNLAMGSNKVTGLAAPTDANDATSKTYVDGILGSATAASASAAAAATSESNAATSETNASNSASAASTSEANAAASYDSFDDRYLGAKATAPTVDNDGDALIVGALYFNNTTNIMYVYGSGGWQAAGSSVNGTSDRNTYTATSGQTVFAATYDTGYVDVYLNGVKLVAGTDFTATNGTSITLATGAAVNDVVDIVAYGTFVLADHYTEAQSDARFVNVTGDTMTGNLNVGGTVTADGADVSGGADSTGQIVLSQGNTSSKVSRIIGTNQGGTNERGIDFNTFYYADYKRMNISPTGDISFYEDTGTTPKFFWDASAESLGIGTTSPTYKLDVNSGNTNAVARFESTDAAAEIDIVDSGGYSRISNVNGSLLFEADRGNATASSTIEFDIDGSERMRIDSSGNVGIGTSSPAAKLDIRPANEAQNTFRIYRGINSGYQLDYLNISQYAGNSVLNSVGIGNAKFIFQQNGTEAMRIDSSGRVGIGTSSPVSKLSIQSLSGQNALLEIAANGNTLGSTSALYGQDAVGNAYAWQRLNGPLLFGTNNSERMRIDSSGNLLVGTTDPLPNVNNVEGVAISSGSYGGFLAVSRDNATPMGINRKTSDGALLDFRKDGSTVGSIGTDIYSQLFIGEGSTTGFRFDSSANRIMPGATNPSDNLTDLGASTSRFKDLYLSGGVYLGGTGSANKLDDYESGSWTPFVEGSTTAGSASYSIQSATYTKVGNLVYWNARVGYTGHTGSGNMLIAGLPFASSNRYTTGSYSFRDGLTVSSGHDILVTVFPSTSNVNVLEIALGADNTAALALDTVVIDFAFNGVYEVA
jgi:hypothetical protein